jgi:hypothetical protein
VPGDDLPALGQRREGVGDRGAVGAAERQAAGHGGDGRRDLAGEAGDRRGRVVGGEAPDRGEQVGPEQLGRAALVAERLDHLGERAVDQLVGVAVEAVGVRQPADGAVVAPVQRREGGLLAVRRSFEQLGIGVCERRGRSHRSRSGVPAPGADHAPIRRSLPVRNRDLR